jgi:hypothetical protein
MGELTIANWIAIIAVVVGALGASFTSLNYFAARRERQRSAQKNRAQIKATINSKYYEDGWRSVQLHVVPLDEEQRDFRYENWRIERAILIRPKNAILACAANDDYASGVFYAAQPIRRLEGKPEGRPQPFALEFFIKFLGSEKGQMAAFKVTFSHSKTGMRSTRVVSASVPANLESE